MNPTQAHKRRHSRQLLEDVISCGYLASVSLSLILTLRQYAPTKSALWISVSPDWLAGCLPACSLNHSMGMENVQVNFSVLEELSNDTEDGNFVLEMVCRKRTAVAV